MDHQNHNEESGNEIRKAGKQQVFRVPSGYFEKMSVELSEKIHSNQRERGFSRVPYRLITAAVFLFLVIAGSFLYFNLPEPKKLTAGFTYDDLNNSGMISQMDESMIMDVFDDAENESLQIIPVTHDEQQLHDYLIDNYTDINLIISEL